MSKSTTRKRTAAEIPAAYAKTDSPIPPPDKNNPSKFQPTKESELSTQLLGPSDGVTKLFTDSIKDIYWAENHLVKAIPVIANASSSKALKNAITEHLEQTKTHARRLEEIFQALGLKEEAKKCDAMEGLTKEAEGVIEMTDKGSPARDLGIIMASQKVEHYEISAYTGLIKLADRLNLSEVSALLTQTRDEEVKADNTLAAVADNEITWDEE